ncbi:MAG: glycoside hydrolase [Sulfobacillus benefaciens]|uniref:Glycoside hydrolase n=1 Tax=Sulfobacillus benefaciens TaxID=453960 RepID=A0A2T2XJK9_9FIRM|nr:MAG: glycoside hydrolase [Sulfobacillus benefaciens]
MSHGVRKKLWGTVVALAVSATGCGFNAHAAKNESSSSSNKLQVVGFWANDASAGLAAIYQYPHAISQFSPFWYSVDSLGGLTSHVNSTILSQVQKEHIPIVPLVNDATGTQAFLPDPLTRIRAARAIADMVGKMHFQGVNIDFEPPHTHLSSDLTAFAIDLRDFLPRNDVITMDVVPHSGGAYDYSKLAPEINQFILMSYDEHDDGSLEGPVAAMPWVSNIVTRMLSSVPASKIILGIPVYGYSWPVGSTVATTIPYNAVTPIMNQNAKWSTLYQETYARYTTANGPTIAWWESLQGMSQKIALAKKDHLAGVALWHVGYANKSVTQLLLSQIGRQP